MGTELETVQSIPDSALDNGYEVEWVSNGRLVVTWNDDDGTVYSEEYTRVGSPKKAVTEGEA